MNDDKKPWQLDGVSFSDEGAVKAATTKWAPYLAEMEVPERSVRSHGDYVKSIVAFLLENQSRAFDEIAEFVPENTAEVFGEDWREQVYKGLAAGWAKSPLPCLVSVQPLVGPLGAIAYFQKRNEKLVDGVPEVQLDIKIKETMAECRKLKALISIVPELPEGVSRQDLTNMVFEELLTEITREVIGTLYWSCDGDNRIETAKRPSDLIDKVRIASTTIHKDTTRAPANHIIGNDKMLAHLGIKTDISNGQVQQVGTLERKWHVWLDPLFPDNKLMAWYQGLSILDTGLVYTPYQTRPTWDGNPEHGVNLMVRHKISLVNPKYARLIELQT